MSFLDFQLKNRPKTDATVINPSHRGELHDESKIHPTVLKKKKNKEKEKEKKGKN